MAVSQGGLGMADGDGRARQVEHMSIDELQRKEWTAVPREEHGSVQLTDADLESRRASMLKDMQSRLGRGVPQVPEQDIQQGDLAPFLEQDDRSFREAIIATRRSIDPPPTFPSAEEVRTEAQEHVSAICEDHDTLNALLERHEATLQKRWLRKTAKQREKVSLLCMPGMPKKHRPEVHATTMGPAGKPRAKPLQLSEMARDAFLLPNLNLEDLMVPNVLLLFLNSRGRNKPCVLSDFDAESVRIGNMVGALEKPSLNRHVMLFRDRTTPETYGELVRFQNNHDAANLMDEGGVPAGNGLQILTIQRRTLRFLLDCCYEILQDIPKHRLLIYPVSSEPTAAASRASNMSSLAVLNLEAPYRAPVGLNVDNLRAIFHAKKSAAEDHVWALREDPSYFDRAVKEGMDHRYEQIKNSSGQEHPNLEHGKEARLWGPVISDVVASADYFLECWDMLSDILDNLQDNVGAHVNVIPLGPHLPDALVHRLSCFRTFLHHAIQGPLAQLKAGFYASPPFRSHVERRGDGTLESRKTGILDVRPRATPTTHKAISSEGSPEAHLQRLVGLLTEEDSNGILAAQWGHHSIVDDLGRLMQNERSARELVSSRMASIVSDLSVMTEALRQLSPYSGQLFEAPLIPWQYGKAKPHARRLTLPYVSFLDVIEGAQPEQFYQLGLPTDKRFHYPSDKRRTKENHELMRAAEANLDAFWQKVDVNLKHTRQAKTEVQYDDELSSEFVSDSAMYKLLSQARSPVRTALKEKQVEDATVQHTLSDLSIEAERGTQQAVSQFSNGKDEDELGLGGSDGPHGPKEKSRGWPGQRPEDNVDWVELPQTEQAEEEITYAVDARALRAFKILFFTPNASSNPGELPWLDLVHAMSEMKFESTILYGSVWFFKPTNLGIERGIHIHEPHPSGKIPYKICRAHGRRLTRAYGWSSESFVLAEKNQADR